MGQGALRLHAPGARDRSRRGALSKTPGDGGAGVRPDQVQPSDRPLPTTRQIRRALGMAISSGDTQSAEAPQPPNSRRWGLKRPPRRSIRAPPSVTATLLSAATALQRIFPT